ncbi:hypothetical protein ANRL1_00532 [Anaerolineae bacterium]|nr:hypothetical protein ANRL1_00532 [Anaerolineae bacterium]
MPHPDALARLDQSPHEALAMARETYNLAFAKNDSLTLADTALTLAIILNRLGEFRDALPLCDVAATQFSAIGDNEHAARARCEAGWAHTFIGDLSQVSAAMERAHAATTSPLIHARCDWIQGRVLRDQSHYPKAAALFEKARDVFQTAQWFLEAARCERELAHTYIRQERGDTFTLLELVRQKFETAGCALDAALCDYLMALVLLGRNHHREGLVLTLRTRRAFADLQAGFFAAWCDMLVGIFNHNLNKYEDAVKASQEARNFFLVHDIPKEVSACDINLGGTYYFLNRYDEALALYQEAADLSRSDGRETKIARLYNNMGLIHAKQGRISKALDLYQRSLEIFTSKNIALSAAAIRTSLADCYRYLGQYAESLTHLEGARVIFEQHQQRDYLVRCNLVMAEIHLACGKGDKSVEYLDQARSIAATDGLDSLVAMCDRLQAQTTDHRAQALARIENARALFLKHNQTVDAALCDLTEGELHLQWNELAAALACFVRAHATLSPAFPEQAWRAEYGLGRCAALSGDKSAALDHYLNAIRTIAATRSVLVIEQLSNDFFARRQSVFDEAVSLAYELNVPEAALQVIEASKARTFLTLLQNRDWKMRDAHHDPYIAHLLIREKNLRHELNALRMRVAVQTPMEAGLPLRSGADLAAISAAALQELNALSQVYESVVTQLRLATTGLAGVSAPAPFSLAEFRRVANGAFGANWIALDYSISDDTLTQVIVRSNNLEVTSKPLSPFDRAILEDCTGTESDQRELIYRGTLRGEPASSPGTKYLKHLRGLLIPPDLDAATLIIAPHRALHSLPFHALMDPQSDDYLIQQYNVICAPSLQILQRLYDQPVNHTVASPLVVGISQFGEQARALPSTGTEVDAIHRVFDGRGKYLREEKATRQSLLDLDASGELRQFDLLHLATHAIFDGTAPHQSRVLMYDDALTALDILDLTLDARLVMLSACQTALSKQGTGDELLSLAHAFFYAGAHAVLATLWHVEDGVIPELIGRFYRHWLSGKDAVAALRLSQNEMICEGYPPYQWAPFILIGCA